MSRQLTDLESVMQMLVDEHRRLHGHLVAQQDAMKTLALGEMEQLQRLQETSRLRIAGLDSRRRLLVQQVARLARTNGNITLPEIAAAFPQFGPKLLAKRDELKLLMKQIADRSYVAGRLASSVLGHLNTALNLFAAAVGQAGVYTKNGVANVKNRIGVMEAVG
jgi:hypothetical protein